MLKKIYLVSGFLFVGLAFLGVFIPLLPTTPFLLLAAWCFSRSSKRMNHWLMNNRLFGKYLENYRTGRGIPLRVKFFVLSFLWLSIITTDVFLTDHIVPRLLLPVIGLAVTVHILRFKTL